MKILFYCPQKLSLGGGIRLFSQLVPAIAQNSNVQTVGILTHDISITKSLFDTSAINLPIEIIYIPTPLWLNWLLKDQKIWGIFGTRLLTQKLSKLLLGDRSNWIPNWQIKQLKKIDKSYDIVYYFWPHSQNFPCINKPIVSTFQDTTMLDFPEIMGGLITSQEWIRSKNWVEKSWIIVSSENTKNRLIHHFGNSVRLISKIPHATLPWKANPTSSSQSRILKETHKDCILYLANINTHKNHYNLLIALSCLQNKRKMPLVLAGSGTEFLNKTSPNWSDAWNHQSARLIGLIDRLELKHGIDFHALGYVTDQDALTLLQNAKAIIMPSLSEGGGSYPVEEALTFGVPVICSAIPVMREHLSTWATKVVWVDPNSPDSILTGINEMFDNYEIYKQSALDNMNTPRQTWDEIAAKYVEVFKMAIDQYKLDLLS
jgi:glycosyltransferase involved in cell wall biosynthesis